MVPALPIGVPRSPRLLSESSTWQKKFQNVRNLSQRSARQQLNRAQLACKAGEEPSNSLSEGPATSNTDAAGQGERMGVFISHKKLQVALMALDSLAPMSRKVAFRRAGSQSWETIWHATLCWYCPSTVQSDFSVADSTTSSSLGRRIALGSVGLGAAAFAVTRWVLALSPPPQEIVNDSLAAEFGFWGILAERATCWCTIVERSLQAFCFNADCKAKA